VPADLTTPKPARRALRDQEVWHDHVTKPDTEKARGPGNRRRGGCARACGLWIELVAFHHDHLGAAPTRMVKVPGGTMTIAESAAAGPELHLPDDGWRVLQRRELPVDLLDVPPLYWFGTGYTPDLNPGLSVAKAPVYSNGGKTSPSR